MKTFFRDLVAWQKAVDLAVRVYEASESFPKQEQYGLTLQMRKSAVSVASNIAEGDGRFSPREYKRFLGDARGSLFELETQLVIASRLRYLSELDREELFAELVRVGKLLNGLVSYVSSCCRDRTPNT